LKNLIPEEREELSEGWFESEARIKSIEPIS
jgi:hypothetical protein